MVGCMKNLVVAAALFVSTTAAAESKLTTTVYTGSPGGFLVNSTIVAGDRDAVLVDAQFTLPDAHRLVAQLLESKKNLTTIYVTHYHPDHYFGLAVIKQAFPKAKLVTTASSLAEIKKTWQAKVKQWRPMYGALVPAQPALPTALPGKTIELEGQRLEIRQSQGDSADNTFVWIPSTKTAITGDIVYNGVHVWTAETTAASGKAWIKTLDELAALGPTTVIAGHKDPKAKDDAAAIRLTKDYLETFDAAVASSSSSAEVQQKVKAKYGTLQLDIILLLGADAQFAPKK